MNACTSKLKKISKIVYYELISLCTHIFKNTCTQINSWEIKDFFWINKAKHCGFYDAKYLMKSYLKKNRKTRNQKASVKFHPTRQTTCSGIMAQTIKKRVRQELVVSKVEHENVAV